MVYLKLGLRTRRFGLLVLGGALFACSATQPSEQLVDARRSYAQASTGAAARLVPDRVLSAKQALDRAERAHEDDAGSAEERGLAYLADRQARLALTYAGIAKAEQEKAAAEAAYVATQDQLRKQAEQELQQKANTLAQTQTQLNQAQTQISEQKRALSEAEKKAAAAIASLEKIASIKQGPRGTVITLSGAVLFTTGKTDILPVARERLTQVAEALKSQDTKKKILVEGHTDSIGSEEANLKLSRGRAESVRRYLISRGLNADQIEAIGKGEAEPVADDATPEGRANNRRVEIIIPDPTS